MLFRGPDSELAAAVQKSHQVPHAVVIAVSPGWDLGIPQGLDELRRARIRRRQTGHSVRGDQGGRMGIAHLVAIQRELADILEVVGAGRTPLVLTSSKEHLDRLLVGLSSIEHVITLKGGMGKKQRQAAAEKLASIPDGVARDRKST